MSPRVYVPTSLAGLASYAGAGEVPAAADRFVAPDETEEGEYAALVAAGAAAAELLDGPGRRVFLCARRNAGGALTDRRPAVARVKMVHGMVVAYLSATCGRDKN